MISNQHWSLIDKKQSIIRRATSLSLFLFCHILWHCFLLSCRVLATPRPPTSPFLPVSSVTFFIFFVLFTSLNFALLHSTFTPLNLLHCRSPCLTRFALLHLNVLLYFDSLLYTSRYSTFLQFTLPHILHLPYFTLHQRFTCFYFSYLASSLPSFYFASLYIVILALWDFTYCTYFTASS